MPHRTAEAEKAYRRLPHQRERKRAYMREYNERTREQRLAKAKLRWQNHDPEEETARRRKRRYGLTKEKFDALFRAQTGLCALCRTKPAVDVDHCHGGGHVRGLLCRACNLGLGMFADDPQLLSKAIEYIANSNPLGKGG